MDIDNIPYASDFREHIREALSETRLVLAIVGPNWIGERTGANSRIHEDNDPVRVEIEIALHEGIPILPILVGGATMPSANELPNVLKAFAYRNAAEVEAGRAFNYHIERLVRSMDEILGKHANSIKT